MWRAKLCSFPLKRKWNVSISPARIVSEAVGYPAEAWLGSLLVIPILLSRLNSAGARTGALPTTTAG